MKTTHQNLKRPVLLVLVLMFAVMATVPDFMLGKAYAGQVQFRSITMDNSTPGATSNKFTVSFRPTITTNIGGIVVDFCADSPIVLTSTCTLPTGFTLGTTPAITMVSGIPTSGWVATNSLQGAAAASNFQVLKVTNPTPQTPTGTGTPIVFSVNTVTNPSTLCSTTTACTFYARIVTFDTSANAVSNYTATGTARATTINNTIDYGGVALSTATNIALTARVMETLAFCVYPDNNGGGAGTGVCGNAPSLELGTGTPPAIDSNSVYTGDFRFSLSTNAVNGSTVYLYGGTLTSGGNTIAARTSAAPIVAGTAAFGVRFASLGSMTAGSNYPTSANYYLGAAAGTAPGETFATSAGPVNASVTQFSYGATASNTTPAGIYTATHRLVAVGSF